MVSRSIGLGVLFALDAAASLAGASLDPPAPRKRNRFHPYERHIPNDWGPVVDSTKESKRARRRRLARAREGM